MRGFNGGPEDSIEPPGFLRGVDIVAEVSHLFRESIDANHHNLKFGSTLAHTLIVSKLSRIHASQVRTF